MSSFPFLLLLLSFSVSTHGAGQLGINYGRVADNLPTPTQVVELLKSHGINRIKIFDTESTVLKALADSPINVVVALPNQLLRSTAADQSFADNWVKSSISQYYPRTQIEAIAVGNEVFVDPQNSTQFLVSAMKNIHNSLLKFNLSAIKVSSPIALSSLQNSYPASSGSFKPDLIEPVMKPMLEFLRKTDSYLMVNAYPFFAYAANSKEISLDYALFKKNPGVVDSGNGLKYFSLLESELDAVYNAMKALKYDDVKMVVTETGWPSKGEDDEIGASADNAASYNGNLIKRVLTGNGTPLRPKEPLNVYLFALFNENQKTGPTSERNYGLFYPNQDKVYDVSLTQKQSSTPVNKNKTKNQESSPPVNKNKTKNQGSSPPVNKNKTKNQESSPPVNKYTTQTLQVDNGGGGKVAKTAAGQTWCVANGKAGEKKLQAAIDYACGRGGADCRPIQVGATCYNPNTIEAHASYAINSYYQKNARAAGTCNFDGAAYVVTQPPSKYTINSPN
ncbi:glucan endo-1,3-beta-glucosidase 14-like [Mercurialis annua]|uniref:glucan endo-1,3-beta-glucosidase 14-like n=1 Tax=Mercurialis annua TaxID=3986 RepID=UPI00215FBD96|nr:glucan endo-1,3-beta-glucosidase 14-like [Mercurialis annua]